MTQNAVAIGVVLLLLVPGTWWVLHTRLVGARDDVDGSWAEVDAELASRHELVPQLVASVEAAAVHEPELLTEVTLRNDTARGAPHTPSAANQFEPPLADAIARVLALQAVHPALDARQEFGELQRQLATIEDRIAAARRFYDTRVERLNQRIDTFPSGLVARRHGFAKADFFVA